MKKHLVLLLFFLFNAALIHSGEKEIFNAMKTEVSRSMEKLRIEGMDEPFFISLRMWDTEGRALSSVFGSLTLDNEYHSRSMQAIVRVGTPKMDNTNFKAERDFSFSRFRFVDLPYADDLTVLRQAFWLSLDSVYKKSLEQLSKKKGYMEKHPQEEYPDDFLPLKKKTVMELPVPELPDITGKVEYIKTLSNYLRDFGFLTDGTVRLYSDRTVQYYTDSDGNRHVRPEQYLVLSAHLETETEDWYPLSMNLTWVARSIEGLPLKDEITKELEDRVRYLEALKKEKPLEEYIGPVLFSGKASGRFFLDILGKGVSGARPPLSDAKDRDDNDTGFLVRRLKQKVLPESYEVWDRPNEKEWNKNVLTGFMPVDDEGVRAQDLHIVEKGKLVALPTRRTATRKYSEINGHARGSLYEPPDSSVTNLFIEDKNGLSKDEFLKKACAFAKDLGIEEILFIESLEDSSFRKGSFSSDKNKSILSAPAETYLLNVRTGKKKPVWGLEFTSVNEKVLTDIIFTTKELSLCRSKDRVSVVAPDILIGDLILRKKKIEKSRPPDVPMPEIRNLSPK